MLAIIMLWHMSLWDYGLWDYELMAYGAIGLLIIELAFCFAYFDFAQYISYGAKNDFLLALCLEIL